jgi:arginase
MEAVGARRKIRIIGVPSTWGAPGPGARRTPARLREAGIAAWLADAGLEVQDTGDVAVAPQGDDDFPGAEQVARVAEMARGVRAATASALRDGCLPLLIGGECSLSIGAVAALAAHAGPVTIAWLDAHGDLNTPATSTSGLLTGMPLAIALGHGHAELLAVGEDTPRPAGAATFLLGGRDLDAGERDNLAAFGVRHIDTHTTRAVGPEEVTMEVLGVPEIAVMPPEARARLAAADPAAAAALAGSPRPPVYLHFDVDALDPEHAPGVYYPVAGGFDPSEVATLAGYLCASGRVGVLAIASADLERDFDGRTIGAIRDVVVSASDALAMV